MVLINKRPLFGGGDGRPVWFDFIFDKENNASSYYLVNFFCSLI